MATPQASTKGKPRKTTTPRARTSELSRIKERLTTLEQQQENTMTTQTQTTTLASEQRLAEFLNATEPSERENMKNAIRSVASHFSPPVGNGAATTETEKPKTEKPKLEETTTKSSFIAGLIGSSSIREVSFTRREALREVASQTPSREVVQLAEQGLMAAGVNAAFQFGLVKPPKPSLWVRIGQGIGAAVAIAGVGYLGYRGAHAIVAANDRYMDHLAGGIADRLEK